MPRQPKKPRRDGGREYRFRIDAYTPDTMPMARLAEYMGELSQMLGERNAVHFLRLEGGSTILVHKIEREAVPKVRGRIAHLPTGDGPSEAVRAYKAINKMLRDDDAVGTLRGKGRGGVVIYFPGRDEAQEEFASIKQYGSIDGVVTWIGGSDQTAHITFDTRAAIEVAAMTRELLNSRERRRGTSSATWTKIKFDRQIVAIAKVCNATVIYSDDEDIRKIAARAKIKVQGLADLPLPPEDAQLGLELTGSAEDSAQPEAVTERDERAKRAKPSYRWEV
jgi:hypothetical protein